MKVLFVVGFVTLILQAMPARACQSGHALPMRFPGPPPKKVAVQNQANPDRPLPSPTPDQVESNKK